MAAVKAVAPVIAAWRELGDRQRCLPEPVVEALREAGLFGLAVDRSRGGTDLDDLELAQVAEELAREDASVAWNIAIATNGTRVAAHLPEAGLREMYVKGPCSVSAGSLFPKGFAEHVGGGFRVSGVWSMASGCTYADWMRAPAAVVANGAPNGRAEARVFYVPRSDCELLDTWRTTGMRATGSNDFRINQAFVPEDRSVPLLLDGPPQPGALRAREVSTRARAALAAVALGIARDAIASLVQTWSATSQAARHSAQERVARAEALVRGARAYLHSAIRNMPDLRDWSAGFSDSLHADIRLACAHATSCAVEAVDLMYGAAGTKSVYEGGRLERSFRDIHVVMQHIGLASTNFELVGQYLMGDRLPDRR